VSWAQGVWYQGAWAGTVWSGMSSTNIGIGLNNWLKPRRKTKRGLTVQELLDKIQREQEEIAREFERTRPKPLTGEEIAAVHFKVYKESQDHIQSIGKIAQTKEQIRQQEMDDFVRKSLGRLN